MQKVRLENVRKARIKKIKTLFGLGINPFASKVKAEFEPIIEVKEKEGEDKGVVGRIWSIRTHGSIIFADIKDSSGKIQLWFQKKHLGERYRLLSLLDTGDFFYAFGKVVRTQAGEISLDVYDFQFLTKSILPLPSTWYGLKDVEERYRKRYLDLLLNEDIKKVFEKRAQIVKLLRKYLDASGFLEVKTPALQPIYGGASAKPFITHHNALNFDLFLRISDELYLKRLIVGGFDKVYEICTDFRNEGIDRWHNPEFTMLEFYWAYADYNDLMEFTEKMLSEVVREVNGSYLVEYGELKIDFTPPWKRISFSSAFLEHVGVDIDRVKTLTELKRKIEDQFPDLDLGQIDDKAFVLDEVYKSLIRDKLVNPTFLIDHPYFMRPLAKRKFEEPEKVESFQLVAGGVELVNAYSELNDPIDQRKRWEEEIKRSKKGVKEYQVVDEDFLTALEYGMPPTAGWGLGIDRFTAIINNVHSIKDVILFPTLRPKGEKNKR